jgi:CDP-diacylglycerol--glycerol-3-phosphate 3-phosphatidyltransferase
MWKALPNILTLSRIFIIPAIIGTFYFGDSKVAHQVAAALFLLAGVTDFLDGHLARAWSIQSALGKFLDPIADKLIVGAVIVMLVRYDRVDVLPSIAIICREILVSGLREFLAEIRVSVPVSEMAKVKTAVQMIAMFLLLLGSKGSDIMVTDLVGRIALWVAAGLTVFTGYAYLKAGLQYIRENENS